MEKSKAETIYIQIKHDLYGNKYSLGEFINEKKLAAQYGVSKTPVREALALLSTEGFLIKFPRRGYCIREVNYQEYYELTQFRYLLELGAARIIIGKCSDDEIRSLFQLTPQIIVTIEEFRVENRKFHEAMANLTRNRYISASVAEVFDRSIRDTSIGGFERMKDDMHKDHRRIVQALLDRKLDLVSEILHKELKRFGEDDKFF